jgi:hypothetical protein
MATASVRRYLEQGGGVGDVVAHPPLRGDADLILLDGNLLPRLLHPLVPVHPCLASPLTARNTQCLRSETR